MSTGAETRYGLEVFGLSIESDWPLPGSQAVVGGAIERAPLTRVRRLSAGSFLAEWDKPSELVFEPKYADGRKRVLIRRTESHYLLWFDVYGRFIVSLDGAEVGCEASGQLPSQERILFAQLLPLAAVLSGFEVLHGSAVVAGDGVAVFIGRSGIGKTTLASRLVLRGAALVTDDVLTIEPTADGPVAHPGPPVMVVVPGDGIPSTASRRLGPALGQTDKIHVSVPTDARPLPLRAVYNLEPAEAFSITALDTPNVAQLLGSVFVPYLSTPDRLRRHLEMAQLLDESVRHFRIELPRTSNFDPVVDSVEAHLRTGTGRC